MARLVKLGMFISIVMIMTGCIRELDSTFRVEIIDNQAVIKTPPTSISVLHNFDDPASLEWIQASLEAYEKDHKELVFDVTSVSAENYVHVLHQKYASGEMPDIYFIENIYDNVLFIDSGFAMELTSEDFMRENFISGALEGVEYNGQLWAVPIEWNGYGVIYNKKLFRGLQIEALPETHKDFLDLCELIDAAGFIPITGGFQEKEAIMEDLFVDVNQSSYVNNTDWRISIERDLYYWEDNFFKFSDALLRMSQRLPYYDDDRFDMHLQEATEKVAFGEAAMILGDFDTLDAVIAQTPDASVGMFMFPWTDDVNRINFPIKTVGGFVANPKSKNEAYLMDVMAYFTSAEVGEYTQLYKQRLPIVKGVEAKYDTAYSELNQYINQNRKVDISTFTSRFKDERLNTLFSEAIVKFVFDEDHNVDETIRYLDEETQKSIVDE